LSETEEFNFEEIKSIPQNQVLLEGLPDTGLLGTIAAVHLVKQKALEPSVNVESDLISPIVVVRQNKLYSPILIHSNSSLSVLTSEVPISAEISKLFSRSLCNWLTKKNFSLVISIGGLADPNRLETETPAAYFITNIREKLQDKINFKNMKPLDSAFLAGPKAVFLYYCFKYNIPTLGIFVESFPNYPDPGAAAVALNMLVGIEEMKSDVSELIKSGEEMRVRFRDLMRRTSNEMAKAGKSKEFEMPSLLV
jgi:uncharacterized protein